LENFVKKEEKAKSPLSEEPFVSEMVFSKEEETRSLKKKVRFKDITAKKYEICNQENEKPSKGCYKNYSTEFKEDFILSYLDVGLGKACLAKAVNVDVASKWVKSYKMEGLMGLVDKRSGNSGIVHQYLDEYVMQEFKRKREKGVLVNSLMLPYLF